MEVEIIEKKPMTLAGMSYYGPMKGEGWTRENPIGQLWMRFIEFWNDKVNLLEGQMINKDIHYEVHIWNKELFEETGNFEVFIGVEVEKLKDLPLELDGKVLPKTHYAKLTVKGDEIKTWESKLAEVLPGEKYPERKFNDMQFLVQCYDERFKGLDKMDESEMNILIPVEKGEE